MIASLCPKSIVILMNDDWRNNFETSHLYNFFSCFNATSISDVFTFWVRFSSKGCQELYFRGGTIISFEWFVFFTAKGGLDLCEGTLSIPWSWKNDSQWLHRIRPRDNIRPGFPLSKQCHLLYSPRKSFFRLAALVRFFSPGFSKCLWDIAFSATKPSTGLPISPNTR